MVFFGLKKRPALIVRFDNTGESFDVDCTLEITPQRSATITKHPTEKGFKFGDNREKNPKAVNVSGIMSDVHPGRGFSIINAITNTLPAPNTYHKDFRERIHEADDNDEPITIDCGERGVYEGYYLTNVDMPSTPADGKAVRFSLSLEENVVVITDVQQLVKEKNKLVAATEQTAETKAQGATPVTDADTAHRWTPGKDRGMMGTQFLDEASSAQMGNILSNPGF